MPISTTATSGFSSIAMSTASRPFAASPTTLQPCREWRTARAPRRTNPWSSAIRMRSFFTFVLPKRYCHAHRCAVIGGINLKPPSDQLHSLLHAGDADTDLESGLVFPSLCTGRESVAEVTNFQREFRVAMNSYLGSLTSRMALNVGEALLH